MRTPLAWRNLMHERNRLMVAIAGVSFAVLLIFMNLGFLGALAQTASQIYSQMNAQIFLISPQSLEISTTEPFSRERLYQAAGVPGVTRVMPVYVGYGQWRNPITRRSRALFIYGINPHDPVFTLASLQTPDNQAAIRQPNVVLIDTLSNPAFGPLDIGTVTELERIRVTVGGQYSLGGGFAADGTLIVSDQNFRRLFTPRPLTLIDLGLIQVQPGVDPDATAEQIRAQLPKDVLVLTQAEMIDRETTYWITTTSIGFIFGLGVIVSFVVGTIIVYQILFTDIRDHLSEYATLKAMGYRNRYLFKVVAQEGLLLAVMGYVPGYILALALYQLTYKATNGGLPIVMDLGRAIFVLILAISMCSVSALISVRKVITTDPAEVFS